LAILAYEPDRDCFALGRLEECFVPPYRNVDHVFAGVEKGVPGGNLLEEEVGPVVDGHSDGCEGFGGKVEKLPGLPGEAVVKVFPPAIIEGRRHCRVAVVNALLAAAPAA
jgi:hypothetical protein